MLQKISDDFLQYASRKKDYLLGKEKEVGRGKGKESHFKRRFGSVVWTDGIRCFPPFDTLWLWTFEWVRCQKGAPIWN